MKKRIIISIAEDNMGKEDQQDVTKTNQEEYVVVVPQILKPDMRGGYYRLWIEGQNEEGYVTDAVKAESSEEALVLLGNKIPKYFDLESCKVELEYVPLFELVLEEEKRLKIFIEYSFFDRNYDPEKMNGHEYAQAMRAIGQSEEYYYSALKEENEIQEIKKYLRKRVNADKITLAEFEDMILDYMERNNSN